MRTFLTFPLSFLMVVLACLRALIDAAFGVQHNDSSESHQLKNENMERNNIEFKTTEVAKAADALEEQQEHDKRRFQTLYFKIEIVQLMGYHRAEILITDVAGGFHPWYADVDENGILMCDESMPPSLLRAIRKTSEPRSTLCDLTRLIQAEVNIQLPILHHENRRRMFSMPDLHEDLSSLRLGLTT